MLQDLFEFEERLPGGMRPTWRGAVFILRIGLGWQGKLFGAMLVGTEMLMLGARQGMLLFLELTLVAMTAGAVAGTVYGIMRPLQRVSALGIWLRWSVTLFAYVLAFIRLTPSGPFTLHDPAVYPIAAGFAVLGGAFAVLVDDRSLLRPSNRKFELQQLRKRLWTRARARRLRSTGLEAG